MAESMLLRIARESIVEVLEAKRSIDVDALVAQEPLLKEPYALFVTLISDNVIRGSSGSIEAKNALIDTLIYHAKVAAFEDNDTPPITTSIYLKSSIDVSLISDVTPLHVTDFAQLLHVREAHRGLCLREGKKEFIILPQFTIDEEALRDLFESMQAAEMYSFSVEHAQDKPIIKDSK